MTLCSFFAILRNIKTWFFVVTIFWTYIAVCEVWYQGCLLSDDQNTVFYSYLLVESVFYVYHEGNNYSKINFSKTEVCNLQTRKSHIFRKSHMNKLMKSLTNGLV